MTSIIPGLYGLDSASAWRALSKDPNKYITKFSQDKAIQKEITYFGTKAPKFTSVDDLVKDRRALKYVLDSYGLGSEINNTGRIKKVLSQDPTATDSLVNQLADPKFKALASSLRLDQGMSKLQRLSFRDTIQDKYIQNEFEEALGEQDSALRQTAYFARNSNAITDVYSVLGDKVLRDVVTNTFNLPQQLAIQTIETQAGVIAKRVDVTKFASSATVASATQLSRAKSDHDLIGNNLAISDAAIKQITTLQTQLTQLTTDYANLGTVTDPAGTNASLITVQQNAVPELARYEELLNKADKSLTSVSSSINALKDLVTQAQQTGSDITALKTQFSNLASAIISTIDNSNVTTFQGSENILLNGTADTLTTVFDENGSQVSLNRYDATGLKSLITDAETAFNAVTDSTDATNLLTTQSRLFRSDDQAAAIHTQVTTDLTALDTTVKAHSFFAATLDTGSLLKGKQSVDDALSRNSQVETLLNKISALATTSKNLGPTDDRSALETQFNTYRTQIRDLIENTGTTGLDNFLDNAPDQSYDIINGKTIQVKGGFDLASNIADVLDTLSLSDASSAATLETQSLVLTNQNDAVQKSLVQSQPILDRVVGSYDPRGRLDSQVLALKTQLDTLISGAAVGGINLLSATQTDIKFSVSTGSSLTFRAQTSFKTDALTGINNAIAQIGGSSTNVLDALDDLSDILTRASRNLGSDNRVATIEYGRLGATIDTLDPQNTSSDSNAYKTNAFTQKFLLRYLGLNGSASNTGGTSYLSNLFGGTDSKTATGNLMSLALSLKA